MGWQALGETLNMRMKKILPELANFYMAGQRVEPYGNVTKSARSGWHVTQIICNQDKQEFVASIP